MAHSCRVRNITRDLQQRLDELQAERAQILRQLGRLAEKEKVLRSLLEQEQMRPLDDEEKPK